MAVAAVSTALDCLFMLVAPDSPSLLFAYCCSSRYVPGKRKEKADVLRLLPLVPPGGLPAAPCSQRTWRVLVVPSDASAEPQAVAVTGGCGMFMCIFVVSSTQRTWQLLLVASDGTNKPQAVAVTGGARDDVLCLCNAWLSNSCVMYV